MPIPSLLDPVLSQKGSAQIDQRRIGIGFLSEGLAKIFFRLLGLLGEVGDGAQLVPGGCELGAQLDRLLQMLNGTGHIPLL